jgi:APA family basic amino acid/polyamine antiporter
MSQQLKRTLKLPHLVFYGVGTMVGAGIYSVIGAAAAEAGAQLWLSFLFAGVAAFLTVLSYAELISMYPDTGAEYNFLKAAFPERPIFSFMAGYLIALNAAATSATVALAFAGYLNVFVEWPAATVALALLVACTALNIAGIRESTWVSIGLICIEVAGLLLLIWTGFESGDMWRAFEAESGAAREGSGIAGIFTATALIFFIYIGFEDVANLSEETHEPVKTVPRALLASVLFTSALYVLVALAFLALSNPQDAGNSASPLSDAAATIAPWRGEALAIAALFATASTALISLISISRMLFGMARGGDMPKPLSFTLSKRQTPWVAALVLFVAACLLLPLGEVKTVASVSSFGVLIVFAAVQAAMIALRLRQPDRKRPFRVAWSIGRVPVLPVIGIALIAALLTQFAPVVYAVGGGAIVLGAGVYFWFQRGA